MLHIELVGRRVRFTFPLGQPDFFRSNVGELLGRGEFTGGVNPDL